MKIAPVTITLEDSASLKQLYAYAQQEGLIND